MDGESTNTDQFSVDELDVDGAPVLGVRIDEVAFTRARTRLILGRESGKEFVPFPKPTTARRPT